MTWKFKLSHCRLISPDWSLRVEGHLPRRVRLAWKNVKSIRQTDATVRWDGVKACNKGGWAGFANVTGCSSGLRIVNSAVTPWFRVVHTVCVLRARVGGCFSVRTRVCGRALRMYSGMPRTNECFPVYTVAVGICTTGRSTVIPTSTDDFILIRGNKVVSFDRFPLLSIDLPCGFGVGSDSMQTTTRENHKYPRRLRIVTALQKNVETSVI